MKKFLIPLTIIFFLAGAGPASAQIPNCPTGQSPALANNGTWSCTDTPGRPNTTGIVVTPNSNSTGNAVPITAQPVTTNPDAFCNAQNGGKCTYTSLEPLPLPGGGAVDASSFPTYVASGFKLLLAAGATIAVVMLIIGALTYMFSDVITDKFKAKERIRNAMWGILILICSYLILNTINPDLVIFPLDLAPLTVPLQSQPTGNTFNIPAPPTQQQIDLCEAGTNSLGLKKRIVTGPNGTWACQ